MNKRLTKISKYLTFILRHEPESIALRLDPEGWANVDELVEKANASGKTLNSDQIHQIVAESDQQRFLLSEDGQRIRAC